MKVVILAAGMGSRLGEADLPKPLTHLETGQTILGLQLENIAAYLSLNQVIVVVGYRKETIIEHYPDLLYVYNPLFASENTSKSLMRALSKVDDDVLWMNGDVVFHPSVLEQVLELKKTCMLVNQAEVGEEEVKYRADDRGIILEVSKQVRQPQGEALGLNLFIKADLPALKMGLVRCEDRDYFEKGIEFCIQQGTIVHASVTDSSLCAEIDFPEDLTRANSLIKQWKTRA